MKSLVFKGSGVEMQEKKNSNVFSQFVIQTCDIVDQGACMTLYDRASEKNLDWTSMGKMGLPSERGKVSEEKHGYDMI